MKKEGLSWLAFTILNFDDDFFSTRNKKLFPFYPFVLYYFFLQTRKWEPNFFFFFQYWPLKIYSIFWNGKKKEGGENVYNHPDPSIPNLLAVSWNRSFLSRLATGGHKSAQPHKTCLSFFGHVGYDYSGVHDKCFQLYLHVIDQSQICEIDLIHKQVKKWDLILAEGKAKSKYVANFD